MKALLALLGLVLAAGAPRAADLDTRVRGYLSESPSELRVTMEGDQLLVSSLLSRASGARNVRKGDQLLTVDGAKVSLRSLSEALQGSPGDSVVLPIVDDESYRAEDGSLLVKNFARIQIFRPEEYVFRPTSPERVAALKAAQEETRAAAEAEEEARRAQQSAAEAAAEAERRNLAREEQARAQEEARKANDVKEVRRREEEAKRREAEELRRKREAGEEYEYHVLFDVEGPMGLQLDPEFANLTITDVIRGGSAAKLGVMPRDLLLKVNDKEVVGLTPAAALTTLSRANWPKRVHFRRPAVVVEEEEESVDLFLVMEAPLLLQGVALQIAAASWSPAFDDPCEVRKVLLSVPEEACEVPRNSEPGALMIAHRGTCPFYEKYMHAVAGEAAGLLVVNNAENVVDMPHGQPEDPTEAAVLAMLPKFEGSSLARAVSAQEAYGRVGAIAAGACASGLAGAALPPMPQLSGPPRDGDEGGVLYFQSSSAEKVLPFHAAHDGPAVNGSLIVPLVVAVPSTGCSAKNIKVRLAQSYVLVARGDCAFGDKVLAAQQLGALGVIIYNTDGPSFRVSLPEAEAEKVKIPVIALSSEHGMELVENIAALPTLEKAVARLRATDFYYSAESAEGST